MKLFKHSFRTFIITFVILLILGIIPLSKFIFNSNKESNEFKNLIGISLPEDSQILINEDTHEGPFNEGTLYIEVQLSESGIKTFIKTAETNDNWMSLPLRDDVYAFLFGGTYNNAYITSHEDSPAFNNIPKELNNGIYLIRRNNGKNETYEENFNNIFETHYDDKIISILDFETNKLYIYQSTT